MKKIAHFVERFPVGGQEYVYDQFLNNDKIESILITECLTRSENTTQITPFYFKKNSNFSFFNKINNRLNNEILNSFYIKRFNSFAKKIIRGHKISIIHAHFATEGYKLIELKKNLGIPLFVTFYGVDASYCLKHEIWIERYKRLFEFSDVLIVLCEEVKKRLLNLGCSEEKIRIWDIGINLNEFNFEEKSPKKVIKFLTVARFVEKKGYSILLQAFKKVLDVHQNIKLTVIGYGPLKQKILAEVDELGIRRSINLIDTAKIDNFNQLFKGALAEHDIFILPSIVAKDGDDEGGPPVVITCAQASGLPVISTPVGGITRAIKDNETGFLSLPGNVDDLQNKMKFLINKPELWSMIGQKARSFVEKRFSLSKQLKKLEQFYMSL